MAEPERLPPPLATSMPMFRSVAATPSELIGPCKTIVTLSPLLQPPPEIGTAVVQVNRKGSGPPFGERPPETLIAGAAKARLSSIALVNTSAMSKMGKTWNHRGLAP